MESNVTENVLVLDNFRRWGYLQARLDPFGIINPLDIPELAGNGEESEFGRKMYCGTIGVEFMHILSAERRAWIQERMEMDNPFEPDRPMILERLVRADLLEQTLHARYPGTKRFSLEGLDSLIPLLDEVLASAIEQGADEAVVGMSHRGRLNVMVHTVGRPPEEIFAGFEDVDPRSVLGGGDVKYHIGATGEFSGRNGRKLTVRLASNPSHLEAVDPVAMGRVRAKQTRAGSDGKSLILPVLIHGDAAFAGQGIAAESLNLSTVSGFGIGGTIHIIANNLLGFTARPDELHSSRFASDMAKRVPIPIFHVNADDVDAVVRVGKMALEYRYRFQSSVVIDLIGFRRHGHSEVDDPTMTQPILYQKIKEHPPLWKMYSKEFELDPQPSIDQAKREYEGAKEKAAEFETKPTLVSFPSYWNNYTGGCFLREYDEVETGISVSELESIADALTMVPDGFNIHPKVKRLLDQRKKMGRGELSIDFGMAELIAYASLLRQGIPVRLSGQDSKRGTFSQRHAVWIDTTTEKEYTPLQHLGEQQAWFEVYNSILSEAAVMGFEYGFSREYPEALVLWEAQFGDFANGAQIIIDQFLSSGEDKWDLLSGLVLLLPHGYEGQGPEHSSARIERFLQLAAEDNMQVCQPSTAAQYFHLLRRQALRKWRKPLVVFTPKSMLRMQDAASPREAFAEKHFSKVLVDTEVRQPERVIVCSGKIGRELRMARAERNDNRTAIVFLEQLYPFPTEELLAIIQDYGDMREIVWVQEEPRNMGAHFYVMPRLKKLAGEIPVRSVKRSASAATATGSAKAHELEQRTLIRLAFGVS